MSRRLALKGKAKSAGVTRRQVAALPLRACATGVEVCLVTTRETRRWTVPKGWPMKGVSDNRAALIEAEEEAGLIGTVANHPIGSFCYWKRKRRFFQHVEVAVYPVWTVGQRDEWKEKHQRVIAWAELHDAACAVDDPGLAALLLNIREQAVLPPTDRCPSQA